MQETWVQSLGWEDPLEKAIHSSILHNSMDCIFHGVAKSQTQLSDFHFDFIFWSPAFFHHWIQSCHLGKKARPCGNRFKTIRRKKQGKHCVGLHHDICDFGRMSIYALILWMKKLIPEESQCIPRGHGWWAVNWKSDEVWVWANLLLLVLPHR